MRTTYLAQGELESAVRTIDENHDGDVTPLRTLPFLLALCLVLRVMAELHGRIPSAHRSNARLDLAWSHTILRRIVSCCAHAPFWSIQIDAPGLVRSAASE
jgi:hypothetical protein